MADTKPAEENEKKKESSAYPQLNVSLYSGLGGMIIICLFCVGMCVRYNHRINSKITSITTQYEFSVNKVQGRIMKLNMSDDYDRYRIIFGNTILDTGKIYTDQGITIKMNADHETGYSYSYTIDSTIINSTKNNQSSIDSNL